MIRNRLGITLLWLFFPGLQLSVSHAQSTAFTYQGRLNNGATPAQGAYDLRLEIFDDATVGDRRGVVTNNAVAVNNGLFTTVVDFGFGVFSGGPRWVSVSVRTNGSAGEFIPLSPRQAILPSPYAMHAANATQAITLSGAVPASGLEGVYSNAVSFSNPANAFFGEGGGLNNVNATQLGGRGASQFWQTGGNAGANPTNGTFLGTSDNLPLELRVNGERALRLEPSYTTGFGSSVNTLGGHSSNVISNGVAGGFIGGGGNAVFPNRVGGSYASVLGGLRNTASGYGSLAAGEAADASGSYSTALGYSTTSSGDNATALGFMTTAGGAASTAFGNQCQALAPNSTAFGSGTVSTGQYSVAMGGATIAGGRSSTALGESSLALGDYATALGNHTVASGVRSTAMGHYSKAIGDDSTAIGYFAAALHQSSFVWSDSKFRVFESTTSNQFSIRASGGIRLSDETSLTFGAQTRQMLNLWGAEYGIGVQSDSQYFRTKTEFMWFRGGSHSDAFGDAGPGGAQLMRLGSTGDLILAGTLSQSSDRNVKTDFASVDAQEVLAKVVSLPIQSWSYTNQPGVKHIGPVAQDFHAAFGLNGGDDKHIATVDADGVALAAIQGLHQKLEQKELAISELRKTVAELAELVKSMEAKLKGSTP